MGVFACDTETTSAVPPAKLFKALVLDSDNIIPKVAPQAIKCVDIIEGNGGPGTVKKVTFGEGSQYKYMKQRVDELDQENCKYCYTVFEGDSLGDAVEKICYETKIVASSDGGSIVKSSSKYHTKGDSQIKEEQVQVGKEKALALFKAIESYILAHPDVYN